MNSQHFIREGCTDYLNKFSIVTWYKTKILIQFLYYFKIFTLSSLIIFTILIIMLSKKICSNLSLLTTLVKVLHGPIVVTWYIISFILDIMCPIIYYLIWYPFAKEEVTRRSTTRKAIRRNCKHYFNPHSTKRKKRWI